MADVSRVLLSPDLMSDVLLKFNIFLKANVFFLPKHSAFVAVKVSTRGLCHLNTSTFCLDLTNMAWPLEDPGFTLFQCSWTQWTQKSKPCHSASLFDVKSPHAAGQTHSYIFFYTPPAPILPIRTQLSSPHGWVPPPALPLRMSRFRGHES